ncbi:hypothetical protein PVL30_005229 [Lodderomyces elongisporus]|uniref:uncharacterized protein n=1 Tax=Lodderomyces elongisporus TaxID=36914 RepID=UPI002921536B|nr:uncharacterized protein PVL30_005229 [Lodderomyces elongisporus]WLF81432.1 hypothetical protein PVL30_005229 [Lodderomyces elongisporus]
MIIPLVSIRKRLNNYKNSSSVFSGDGSSSRSGSTGLDPTGYYPNGYCAPYLDPSGYYISGDGSLDSDCSDSSSVDFNPSIIASAVTSKRTATTTATTASVAVSASVSAFVSAFASASAVGTATSISAYTSSDAISYGNNAAPSHNRGGWNNKWLLMLLILLPLLISLIYYCHRRYTRRKQVAGCHLKRNLNHERVFESKHQLQTGSEVTTKAFAASTEIIESGMVNSNMFTRHNSNIEIEEVGDAIVTTTEMNFAHNTSQEPMEPPPAYTR